MTPGYGDSDSPVDVTIKGPEARAAYGVNATFINPGLKDLRREQVESLFQAIFYEAERFRLPHETVWLAQYNQFHGETEDPGKADWQSQAHVPASAQTVNVAASRVINVIFGQEDWFGTRSESRAKDPIAEMAKKMVLWQFEKSRGQDPINQAVKDAFICGNGPLKVHFATEIEDGIDTKWIRRPPSIYSDPDTGEQTEIDQGGEYKFVDDIKAVKNLRFESIIPTDFWLDPSGMNRFFIQRIKRSLSDVWEMARPQYASDGKTVLRKAVYDPDVVQMVAPGSRDMRLDNQAAVIRHERIQSISQQTVDVYEFWGDLVDLANGVAVYKNVFATFVNKQWCVRMPQRNPFLHRKSPFIYLRAQLLPHQIYGYGLLGQTVKLQGELDRLLQVMIDKVHLSVPMAELDQSRMKNPEQFGGDHLKIAPGRTFNKKGAGDGNIITPIQFAQPPNEWEIQLYNIVQNAMQMVAPTEMASGMQMSNQRKTKEEVQIRASGAEQNFNDAAQYMEATSLSPMVNMVYALMIQFEDEYDDPELLEMFADQPEQQEQLLRLKGMSVADRWRILKLDTEFKVTGVTRDITRQQLLQRLQGFIQMIQADQSLAMLIDKRTLLRNLLQIFDLPRDMVLSQADAMLQAQQQQMIQQMMQPPTPPGQQQSPGGTPQPGQPGQPGIPGQQGAGSNPHNQMEMLAAMGRGAAQAPMQ